MDYQQEINQSEHKNPKNWKLNIFYFSTKDSRAFVPKRMKWAGWTLNFAKARSYLWIIGITALVFFVIYLIDPTIFD